MIDSQGNLVHVGDRAEIINRHNKQISMDDPYTGLKGTVYDISPPWTRIRLDNGQKDGFVSARIKIINGYNRNGANR